MLNIPKICNRMGEHAFNYCGRVALYGMSEAYDLYRKKLHRT